ncbi:hypothetical protein HO173_003251 [Letharia columbiana]|uniref:Uncharacterized protein n=1 Tax=Letharia columbiana TaxID=112416 RepID=A0A8H6G1M9_9LECA|nr:uncharacterized protein HO173_003251 [Letharia columbiana]KAF6238745.1 hypothetical protein HO173_003251 [Letharia columbiana]
MPTSNLTTAIDGRLKRVRRAKVRSTRPFALPPRPYRVFAAKDDGDLDSDFDRGANRRFDEEDGEKATRPDEMGTDTESIFSDIEGVVKLTDDTNKAMQPTMNESDIMSLQERSVLVY